MTAYNESLPPPGTPPYVESRVYAMAHLAALNAIRRYGPAYSAEAAIAQAAHDVFVNQFPDGAAGFDDLLAAQLARSRTETARRAGCSLALRPPPRCSRRGRTTAPPPPRAL